MGIRNSVLQSIQPATTAASAQPEKTPAEFYLNIGIERETEDERYSFVDLMKSGVPLDKVPEHDVRGQLDTDWKLFAALQDNLKKQFMEEAQTLAPGETRIIARDEITGLCIQMRRVRNKEEMPIVEAQLNGLSFRR